MLLKILNKTSILIVLSQKGDTLFVSPFFVYNILLDFFKLSSAHNGWRFV